METLHARYEDWLFDKSIAPGFHVPVLVSEKAVLVLDNNIDYAPDRFWTLTTTAPSMQDFWTSTARSLIILFGIYFLTVAQAIQEKLSEVHRKVKEPQTASPANKRKGFESVDGLPVRRLFQEA